jgi:hypothetical protein
MTSNNENESVRADKEMSVKLLAVRRSRMRKCWQLMRARRRNFVVNEAAWRSIDRQQMSLYVD